MIEAYSWPNWRTLWRGGTRITWAMMFIDSAFGSPYVERLRMLGYEDRVMEVNFGSQSPDRHQANQRETLR